MRHGARGCGKTPIPWVSLAPKALASPTAMFLPPLTRLGGSVLCAERKLGGLALPMQEPDAMIGDLEFPQVGRRELLASEDIGHDTLFKWWLDDAVFPCA